MTFAAHSWFDKIAAGSQLAARLWMWGGGPGPGQYEKRERPMLVPPLSDTKIHKNLIKKDLTNSQICGPGNLARALVKMHKKEVITHFPSICLVLTLHTINA